MGANAIAAVAQGDAGDASGLQIQEVAEERAIATISNYTYTVGVCF